MRFFTSLALTTVVLAVPAPVAQNEYAVAPPTAGAASLQLATPSVTPMVIVSTDGDDSDATDSAYSLISSVNSFLSTVLDPFGLIAGANGAPDAKAAASAAIAAAAADPSAAAMADEEGYTDFLAEAYNELPKLNALAFNILTSPLRLGFQLIGGLLKAQSKLLRGLSSLMEDAGIDADDISDLGYAVAPTVLPLNTPIALPAPKGYPAPPKLAPIPKFVGALPPKAPFPGYPSFPKFAFPKGVPPKGYNATAKGLPKAPKGLKGPKGLRPKGALPKGLRPKGFLPKGPKGYNSTAKALPKMPKAAPLRDLSDLLDQAATRFPEVN